LLWYKVSTEVDKESTVTVTMEMCEEEPI